MLYWKWNIIKVDDTVATVKSVTVSFAMTKHLRAPSPLLWHLSVSFKNVIALWCVMKLIKCPRWLNMLKEIKIHLLTGDAIRLCHLSYGICTGSFWASVDHIMYPVFTLAWKFEYWCNVNQQLICWMRKNTAIILVSISYRTIIYNDLFQ